MMQHDVTRQQKGHANLYDILYRMFGKFTYVYIYVNIYIYIYIYIYTHIYIYMVRLLIIFVHCLVMSHLLSLAKIITVATSGCDADADCLPRKPSSNICAFGHGLVERYGHLAWLAWLSTGSFIV